MRTATKMMIKLVAYGIAKEILGGGTQDYEVNSTATIGELKDLLTGEFSEFEKLTSLKFAIAEEYQNDDFVLSANDEVVIIPPVSGG